MIPVPINAPSILQPFMQSVAEAIQELQVPTYPHPSYRTASTTLPPAASYPGCIIDLSDLNTVAKSDGVNWRRVDTGAAL